MQKVRKNQRVISEKNDKLRDGWMDGWMDGQTDRQTGRQADNSDFIGPSIKQGSNKTSNQD